MKRFISVLLVTALFLTGCNAQIATESSSDSEPEVVVQSEVIAETSITEDTEVPETESNIVSLRNDTSYFDAEALDMNFGSLGDPDLLDFMEGSVYYELADELGDDAYIENISAILMNFHIIPERTFSSDIHSQN